MITSALNSVAVILIFGSLVLLSFLTIANPLKINKKANFWFGVFVFLWSTFWLDEISIYSIKRLPDGYFGVFIHFIQFLTPVVFYLSVVYFTNPNFKFKKSGIYYLFLPAVFLAILLLQQTYSNPHPALHAFLVVLIIFQILYYSISSFLLIRKHQKKILLFSSNPNEIDLRWLEVIISLILFINIVVAAYNIITHSAALNVFINGFFVVVIYLIAYYSLKQKEIFPVNENDRNEIISIAEEDQPLNQKRKIISDEEMHSLKTKLNDIMEKEQPYLDSEMNLISLAAIMKITPHQLSYVINSGFNENFFQFINKYRIRKAKELLINEKMNKLSILGIAFESGFNSKTSFNTTFRKMTSQTPSEFKKSSSHL